MMGNQGGASAPLVFCGARIAALSTSDGVTYTLTPDYVLMPVQAERAKDAWWLGADGKKVYVKTGDGKSAQGFNVK